MSQAPLLRVGEAVSFFCPVAGRDLVGKIARVLPVNRAVMVTIPHESGGRFERLVAVNQLCTPPAKGGAA